MLTSIAPLRLVDIGQEYFDTLDSLRSVGDLSLERARNILLGLQTNPVYHHFAARKSGQTVGALTLLVEQKFIRNGGLAGHVEDVAVHRDYQGRGIGKQLVETADSVSRELGCYKNVLSCSEENVPFYERCGYHRHAVEMRKDL